MPVRRWHKFHGVREREDSKWPLEDTLDEFVRDGAKEVAAFARRFTGLDYVPKGGGPKVDRVIFGVKTRR